MLLWPELSASVILCMCMWGSVLAEHSAGNIQHAHATAGICQSKLNVADRATECIYLESSIPDCVTLCFAVTCEEQIVHTYSWHIPQLAVIVHNFVSHCSQTQTEDSQTWWEVGARWWYRWRWGAVRPFGVPRFFNHRRRCACGTQGSWNHAKNREAPFWT